MISSNGLKKLGFVSEDFVLQDDGQGAYVVQWISDQPNHQKQRSKPLTQNGKQSTTHKNTPEIAKQNIQVSMIWWLLSGKE